MLSFNDIHKIVNTIAGETLGKTDVLKEDLSNLVDVGNEIFDTENVDRYVKKLVGHIGKVVVADRVYTGNAPRIMADGWTFGNVLEKIELALPESVENESYHLRAGASYDVNKFTPPVVSVKFFNGSSTYDYEMSFPVDQVRMSFSNATQMGAFIAGIENKIQMRKTMDYDALIKRTINYMIANTMRASFPTVSDGDYSGMSSIKAVNLLYEYNQQMGTTLTKDKCLTDLDFLKFASTRIGELSDYVEGASELFNIGEKPKFTPKDLQHLVLLNTFRKHADSYLQSTTFHNELTKLPNAEGVNYWQGTGTDYAFDSISKVHAEIEDPTSATREKFEFETDGIIGVLFDRDSCMVCNVEDTVDTNYNGKGRFLNYFYHSKAQYFADGNENFIVFYVA